MMRGEPDQTFFLKRLEASIKKSIKARKEEAELSHLSVVESDAEEFSGSSELESSDDQSSQTNIERPGQHKHGP